MRALLKIANVIDGVTERIGGLADWLVMLVVGVGFYNVTVRYLGRFIGVRLSSNLYIELQWYLFSMIFFLGFAYILKHGVNVRVDFLYTKWTDRQKAMVDLAGTILVLIPLCIIGIFAAYNPVLQSWGRSPNGNWGTWEVSPDPDGLPRAPIKSMIIVAWATLLLQSISQVIKYAAILRGHTEIAKAIETQQESIDDVTLPVQK
ncbi:MAG: TRAP transporter small permease subunit [Chloroflexi bacterium]|nr:TRAP transporter small permease subunit [Chloroflexota bacterium]